MYLNNLTVHQNRVLNLSRANKESIVYLRGNGYSGRYTISNTKFSQNTGTPLALTSVTLNVTGNIMFNSNNAITGGGLYKVTRGEAEDGVKRRTG